MSFTLTPNALAGFYMFSNVMLVPPRSTVPMYVPWTSASCANISCGNPSVVRKCCTLEPNSYRLSFSFFIRFSIFGCKSNIVHHICQHSIRVENLECARCYKRKNCPNNHICIENIDAEILAKRFIEKL